MCCRSRAMRTWRRISTASWLRESAEDTMRRAWTRWASAAAALACVIAAAQAQQPTVTISRLPDAVWNDMQGRSWKPDMNCPARDRLRLLKVPFIDFSGRTQVGELVVGARVADQVAAI